MLRERGITVNYEPPIETRDAVSIGIAATALALQAANKESVVRAVVRALLQPFRGQDVRVEGAPDEDEEK